MTSKRVFPCTGFQVIVSTSNDKNSLKLEKRLVEILQLIGRQIN